MAVNLDPPEELLGVPGIRLAVAEAGIKRKGRPDVTLLKLAEGTSVAATFTRNTFAAAPVVIARERIQRGNIRALLINSGNANAGTGSAGIADADACCAAAAQALEIDQDQVLPFSTGVIGERLPVASIQKAAADAAANLSSSAWLAGAQAIMTTDTIAKACSRRVGLSDGAQVNITGIAKGSGMIHPNMATMLAFVGTDAAISTGDLQRLLTELVPLTFNSITVDGDTSTNDACVICATGHTKAPSITPNSADWQPFADSVREILASLAQSIVRDAEGATKFVTVQVDGARSVEEAREVAFTVAHSPLVKTACFASDPNWGRILAAVGRAKVEALDVGQVGIRLDQINIVANGEPIADYREEDAAKVMAGPEFTIGISLGRGEKCATIWTSDLSYDYVKINAEYRS